MVSPPIITEETCEVCKFCSGSHEGGQNILICRRYPPTRNVTPTPKGIFASNSSPAVKPTDWCGEFTRRILRPGLNN